MITIITILQSLFALTYADFGTRPDLVPGWNMENNNGVYTYFALVSPLP